MGNHRLSRFCPICLDEPEKPTRASHTRDHIARRHTEIVAIHHCHTCGNDFRNIAPLSILDHFLHCIDAHTASSTSSSSIPPSTQPQIYTEHQADSDDVNHLQDTEIEHDVMDADYDVNTSAEDANAQQDSPSIPYEVSTEVSGDADTANESENSDEESVPNDVDESTGIDMGMEMLDNSDGRSRIINELEDDDVIYEAEDSIDDMNSEDEEDNFMAEFQLEQIDEQMNIETEESSTYDSWNDHHQTHRERCNQKFLELQMPMQVLQNETRLLFKCFDFILHANVSGANFERFRALQAECGMILPKLPAFKQQVWGYMSGKIKVNLLTVLRSSAH